MTDMRYENEEIYAVWMMLSAGDGSSLLYKTVANFNAAEQVYKCDKRAFGINFKEEETERYSDKNLDAAKRIVDYCARNEIKIIPFSSMEYPLAFRNLEKSPCALFVKGNHPFHENKPSVGIVGTRQATAYGKRIASAVSYELSSAGVMIVSGMAKGIDTQAHKGSLYMNNPTVAVVAGGVDVIYPKENEELYEMICSNGAVISEHLPRTGVRSFLFHMRNRLISALSDAVLVVESELDGGSMITVRCAMNQGVPLFAVPGPIDSPFSVAPNRLINDKSASMLTNTQDLIDFLNKKHGGNIAITRRSSVKMSYSEKEEEKKKKSKKPLSELPENDIDILLTDTVPETAQKKPKKPPEAKKTPEPVAVPETVKISSEYDNLSETEKRVYDVIRKNTSVSVDKLCDVLTDLSFSDIVTVIGKLELFDLVCDTGLGNYKVQ